MIFFRNVDIIYEQNIAPEKYNNTIHFTFEHSYRDM